MYSCVNNVEKLSKKEKLHRMLRHINFNYLEKMCKDKLLEELSKNLENEYLKCETCITNKMHNMPFENNRSRANEVLQIVYTGVW